MQFYSQSAGCDVRGLLRYFVNYLLPLIPAKLNFPLCDVANIGIVVTQRANDKYKHTPHTSLQPATTNYAPNKNLFMEHEHPPPPPTSAVSRAHLPSTPVLAKRSIPMAVVVQFDQKWAEPQLPVQ